MEDEDEDEKPAGRRTNVSLGSTIRLEARHQASCKSLPFTVVFWLVFVVTQKMHGTADLSFFLQANMEAQWFSTSVVVTSTPTSQAIVPPPDPNDNITNSTTCQVTGCIATSTKMDTNAKTQKSWDLISFMSDLFDWVEDTLVPFLWADGPDGVGVVYEFNRVIGGMRYKQTVRSSQDCPSFEGLDDLYGMPCYTSDGDNTTQTAWLDIKMNTSDVTSTLERLRQEAWLSKRSRSANVQTVFYNAQVPFLALVDARFELNDAGTVRKKLVVRTLKTELFEGFDGMIGDVLWGLMLFWIFIGEIVRLANFARKRIMREYLHPFRFINWMIIVFGTGFTATFLYMAGELKELAGDVVAIPEPHKGVVGLEAAYRDRWIKLDELYDNVDRLTETMRYLELGTCWYTLLLGLKFLEAFEASPRLAIMTATLTAAFSDLMHFFIVFGTVFINFALGGHFIFGADIWEWHTIWYSMTTTFAAMLGDFDFAAMDRVAPKSAAVWFSLYMLSVTLIMVNMLLAIIMDVYGKVKENTHDTATIWQQLQRELVESKNAVKSLKTRDKMTMGHVDSMDSMASIQDDEATRGSGRSATDSADSAAWKSQHSAKAAGRRAQVEEQGNLLHSLAYDVQKLAERMESFDEVPMRLAQVEETCWKIFAMSANGKVFSPKMLR